MGGWCACEGWVGGVLRVVGWGVGGGGMGGCGVLGWVGECGVVCWGCMSGWVGVG